NYYSRIGMATRTPNGSRSKRQCCTATTKEGSKGSGPAGILRVCSSRVEGRWLPVCGRDSRGAAEARVERTRVEKVRNTNRLTTTRQNLWYSLQKAKLSV